MISAEEQEALLLRQVVALRRSGMSQAQALDHAAEGLTDGPLAARIAQARRALAAGSPGEDLLAAEADVAALDHAARAIDVRLSAGAAVATTRAYLTVAVAGPLVLGSLLSLAGPDLLTDLLSDTSGAMPTGWIMLIKLRSILELLGIPLAIGAVLLIGRASQRVAPGAGLLQEAAELLQVASDGADPLPLLSRSSDRAYLIARQSRVGPARAAAELADELAREGDRAATLFRHLAPLLATVAAVFLIIPLVAMFALPLFSMASM